SLIRSCAQCVRIHEKLINFSADPPYATVFPGSRPIAAAQARRPIYALAALCSDRSAPPGMHRDRLVVVLPGSRSRLAWRTVKSESRSPETSGYVSQGLL